MTDEERDEAAEVWLRARHTDAWYIGNATVTEWHEAYCAVDAAEAPKEKATP